MFTALYTAKSGMTVQQTNIDLHSHNLSNVSTTGFKRNFANVEDLAYQNYRQVGAAATEQNQLPTGLHMGLGARTVSIGRNFEQGSLQESKNSLDVAINGNGFFEVTMPDGTLSYTRDGAFEIDAQGRLVTARSLKARYESRVGHAVPDSTVYRLLARHQWRQVLPRPKHPKDNPRARAAFKKTSGQGGRRGGWTPGATLTPAV